MPGLTRAHIESMKGQPADSLAYCTKEDKDAYQYGTMPQPGKRNDLHTAIELLKEGHSVTDLIRTAETPVVATFVRYPKGLTTVSQVLRQDQSRVPPYVLWLHGSTGTGKTRSAHELAGRLGCGDDIWISNASLQWFDGYNGQRCVLFDDYRTNHATFSFILRLLDRYKLDVPYKGGFVNFQPYLIIITAPKSPRNLWNLRTEEDLAQLERRVRICIDTDGYEDRYSELLEHIWSEFSKSVVDNASEFANLQGLLPRDVDDARSHSGSEDEPESGTVLLPGLTEPTLWQSTSSLRSVGDDDHSSLQLSFSTSQSSCEDESCGESEDLHWSESDMEDASSSTEGYDKVFF